MSERTALYRLYDAKDALLYVGVSCHPELRWMQHMSSKAWWPDVRRYQVDWYDDREAALTAESLAINDERPEHNVAGARWREVTDTGIRGVKVSTRPGETPRVPIRIDPDLWTAFGNVVGNNRRSVTVRNFIRSVVDEAIEAAATGTERPPRSPES